MENKIIISSDYLTVIPQGITKIFAFKSKIKIPLSHVEGATLDKEIMHDTVHGFRFGTYVPGFYRAGSYHLNHEKVFFNVKMSSNPVVIQLKNENFDRLIIGVNDPRKIVQEINNNISF